MSSDDLDGLRLLRDRAPAGMDIAAGEYGYDLPYFRRMLEAGAVDVLQADATRCGGITGFLRAAALCQAHLLPLSAHCAPSLHAHPCCALHAGRATSSTSMTMRASSSHAVRRRAGAGGRRAAPRPVTAGAGHRTEAPGRRTLEDRLLKGQETAFEAGFVILGLGLAAALGVLIAGQSLSTGQGRTRRGRAASAARRGDAERHQHISTVAAR